MSTEDVVTQSTEALMFHSGKEVGRSGWVSHADTIKEDYLRVYYEAGYEQGENELKVALRVKRRLLGSDQAFLAWLNS